MTKFYWNKEKNILWGDMRKRFPSIEEYEGTERREYPLENHTLERRMFYDQAVHLYSADEILHLMAEIVQENGEAIRTASIDLFVDELFRKIKR